MIIYFNSHSLNLLHRFTAMPPGASDILIISIAFLLMTNLLNFYMELMLPETKCECFHMNLKICPKRFENVHLIMFILLNLKKFISQLVLPKTQKNVHFIVFVLINLQRQKKE